MSFRTPIRAVSVAPSSSYVPALEGMRGVAIVGVLLFHTGHLPGGFLGVDLFFVLSGYLITGVLVREASNGRLSVAKFWARRIRRLFPALAVMLGAITILAWMFLPVDLVRTTMSDGPWVLGNVVNWHLLAESASYWSRFGSERVFEHLWSIAVEEQFYVIWPIIVLLVARFSRRPNLVISVVAGCLALGSLVAMILLLDVSDPTRVYTGSDTRAFSLLLGAIASVEPVRSAVLRFFGRASSGVAVLLAASMIVSWLYVEGIGATWLFTGGLFAHSLVCAVLIIMTSQRSRHIVHLLFAWAPLRWLGSVSYSLYLWHWPVIVILTPEVTTLSGWPWTALVCLVSVALATASTLLVENPIRRRPTWTTGRLGVVVTVAAVLALVALWALLPTPTPVEIDLGRLD